MLFPTPFLSAVLFCMKTIDMPLVSYTCFLNDFLIWLTSWSTLHNLLQKKTSFKYLSLIFRLGLTVKTVFINQTLLEF